MWRNVIFFGLISVVLFIPWETNHKTIILTGENLEKEPRIMELRNQVNLFYFFPAFSQKFLLVFPTSDVHLFSHFVVTVQNYQNNWISCRSGEIKWAWEAKGRNVKALFPCFTFPEAQWYAVIVWQSKVLFWCSGSTLGIGLFANDDPKFELFC